jgi:hypothetical protein
MYEQTYLFNVGNAGARGSYSGFIVRHLRGSHNSTTDRREEQKEEDVRFLREHCECESVYENLNRKKVDDREVEWWWWGLSPGTDI